MTQASVNIAQQFKDGNVVPANLVGQDAATKTYVDEELAKRDASIQANATTASGINTKVDTHIADNSVHVTPEEKDTYNGHIANTNIHVTTTDKSNWNSKAPGSVQSDLQQHVGNTDIHTSLAEKTKLAGIQTGAEVNQNAFSKVNDVNATGKTDTLTLTGGTGITVSTNPSNKIVTITATGQATPGPHAATHITGGSDVIPDAVTGGNSGLMSGADAQFVRVDGETKTGAQSKADSAEQAAKTYADSVGQAANDYADQQDALIKGDYVRQPGYATTSGTSTAYTVTLNPAPTSIPDGFGITIVPHVDSGASPTLSINGLTAVPLKNLDGTAIQMKAGKPYNFRKVGTDFLASSGGGGVVVKSVQRGQTNLFGSGVTSIDVTISAIDVASSALKIDVVTGNTVANQSEVLGEIINSTTIRFSINTNSLSNSVVARWELIEFQNIKNIQKGTISGSTNVTGVTIASVNLSKTITFMSYKTPSTETNILSRGAQLTTNTQLLLYTVSNGPHTINYFVVEFL